MLKVAQRKMLRQMMKIGRQGWRVPAEEGEGGSPEGARGLLLLNTTLTGLEPGRRYYYIFGDETFDQWSDEYSFVAPPRIVMQEWEAGRKTKKQKQQHKYKHNNKQK